MAGTSLLLLLDDIAAVLDDVALMTKVAAKKTAGVLGDDLALNAEQVCGVRAERELPVVWAVFKGSLRNKLILVPLALAVSSFVPSVVTPILMLGGAYLCLEGVEKLAHKYLGDEHAQAQERRELREALCASEVELLTLEEAKIKGAIRTDFILSAEIIVIALGAAQESTLIVRIAVVSGVATLMSVGVYALVAGIVKLDDLGYLLAGREKGRWWSPVVHATGRLFLTAAPWLMKVLAVVGTAAMFLVGGGILAHGFHIIAEMTKSLAKTAEGLGLPGGLSEALVPLAVNAGVGILAGILALGALTGVKKLLRKG